MELVEVILKNFQKSEISETAASELLSILKQEKISEDNDIAIIGLAAKFPEAKNVDEYWDNIKNGRDCVRDYPEERKKDSNPFVFQFSQFQDGGFAYSKGGYLEEMDKFDYEFFNMSPMEANLMDPNQRMFLQVAWNSLEDAGLSKETLKESKTGVYLGYSNAPLYSQMITKFKPDLYQMSVAGNVSSIIASRISYLLDLRGPSMLVDTACSSSMVATHLACKALIAGECDMAISGGVKINLVPVEGGVKIGIESSGGVTKTFDDSSTGTVWGEGVAAIVLKPLKKALADGNQIYAVIKGGAINQDGASLGITAPNKKAQIDVICDAWNNAGIDPNTINYIEAHGTGTQLGDTIEIEALTEAFHRYTKKKQFCAVGSVKTNIGHLDTVSGISGLIKVIMALKNKMIPPILHLHMPNRKIDFVNSAVYINDTLRKCEEEEYPLRFGVSSFGFSGTNCHMVLEEAPKVNRVSSTLKYQTLTISASSEEQLKVLVNEVLDNVINTDSENLENLCYTSNVGRNHYRYRLLVIAETKESLIQKLIEVSKDKFESNEEKGIFYGKHRIIAGNRPDREVGDITEDEKDAMNMQIEQYFRNDPMMDESSVLNQISRLYVRGADIPWKKRYKKAKHYIIRFPSYPFRQTRCWNEIDELLLPKVNERTSNRKLAALIDECIQKEENTATFRTYMSPDNYWVLTDHRVQGKCFLAGTVYLEMALEAMKILKPDSRFEFNNVVLLSPFSLYDYEEKYIYITINKNEKGYKFIVKSYDQEDDNNEVIHNQGEILILNDELENMVIDLDMLKEKCSEGYYVPDASKYNDLTMMTFGPHWKNIAEMHIGNGETLALLQLPDEYVDEVNNFLMHPAILDNALATRIKADGNAYLPFSYGSIKVFGKMPSKVYSYVRSQSQEEGGSELLLYDITIMNELGEVLIDITHSARKMLHGSPIQENRKYHTICWKKTSLLEDIKQEKKEHPTLVITNGNYIADNIIQKLTEFENNVVKVVLEQKNEKQDNQTYTIAGEKEDYLWLLENYKNSDLRIINLLSIYDTSAIDEQELQDRLHKGIYSMLRMYQALGSTNQYNNVEMFVITNNAHNVCETESTIYPENSSLIGIAKVINQESSNVSCRAIDIDDNMDENLLINEINSCEKRIVVAYRNNERYLEILKKVIIENKKNDILVMDDNCYLISGGFGGVGIEVAKSLAMKHRVEIILVGRTKIPNRETWKEILERNSDKRLVRIIKDINEIEEKGSKVICYQADISKKSDAEKLFLYIKQNAKPLKGIIQCAAVAGDGFMIQKDEAIFSEVLQPKILGTWFLDNYSRDMGLDFFVLFSSGVSITGLAGQSDYTAANAYLDAYTYYRNKLGLRTTTINWTAWKEVGMAVDHNADVDDAILKAMNTKEAIDAYEVTVGSDIDRVIIGELNFKYDLFRNIENAPFDLDEAIIKDIEAYNKRYASKTNMSEAFQVTVSGRSDDQYTDMEKKVASIFGRTLGLDVINIYDNFYQLGGDSLIALKIINAINEELKTSAVITDLFNHITVNEFAEYLDQTMNSTNVDSNKDIFAIEPIEEKEWYELSSAQMRMYVLNQLEENATSYNISKAYKVKGHLDIKRLENVYKEIVSRHESLRTSFIVKDNIVVQTIQDNVDFHIDYYECDEEKISQIVDEYIRPFDLEVAPLLRLAIIKYDIDEYIMVCDIHHIIADGYSLNVLINEIVTLYSGNTLPNLNIQYKDFIAWQKDFLKSEHVKKQEEYWLDVFKKPYTLLELPTENPRPAVQDYTGEEYQMHLNRDVVDKIKKLAVNNNTTPFVVMLSSYNILLSKYTAQNDIIVGIPVVGRPNQELSTLIGMFVNTLAIRNEVLGNVSFKAFLQQVKERCNEAYDNQDYQFNNLVNQVVKDRDLSRGSIINTIFNMNNIYNSELKMDNLILEDYEIVSKDCTTDILFHCIESGEGMDLGFRYQTSLFSHKYIHDFAESYLYVLDQVIENPERLISEVKLLTESRENAMIQKYSQQKNVTLKEETVLDKFENLVMSNTEGYGIIHDSKYCYDYKTLNLLSDRLATILSKSTKNGTIAVMVQPSAYFVIAVLSIWKVGAAYLPISPEMPTERIQYIMNDVSADTIIVDESIELDGLGFNLIHVEECKKETNATYERVSIVPQDTAYIIYTSGTTGVPKGVMISHGNLYNYVNWITGEAQITSSDKVIIVSSLCFDLVYTSLYSALAVGAELFIPDTYTYQDPVQLIKYLNYNKITFMKTTPSLFQLIVDSNKLDELELYLRMIVLGGEAIHVNDIKKYHARYENTTFMNHYGPTETTIGVVACIIDFNHIEEYEVHPVIGQPIDNTHVYILDDDMNVMPELVYGNIFVAGNGLGKYLDNQWNHNPKSFFEYTVTGDKNERLYKTGDKGRFLKNGMIEFCGRNDEQVKIKGYRVDLIEIKNSLELNSAITEAAVILNKDENGNAKLSAYLVLSSDVTVGEIRRNLKRYLPEYMIPTEYFIVQKIPLTENNKIDKKRLIAENSKLDTGVTFVEPKTEIEIYIANVWKKVLHVDKIGIYDNFFELGGDSISAVQVKAELGDYNIDLRDLFQYSTISELSSRLKLKLTNNISQDKVIGEIPLTAIQKDFFAQKYVDSNYWNQANILYNVNGFDVDMIQKVFKRLLVHHDILRAVFYNNDGNVVQYIKDVDDIEFAIYEYAVADDDVEREIHEKAKAIQEDICFEDGPLFACAVFKTMKGDYLLIVMHHLIIDGISWRILIEDFVMLYQGLLKGKDIDLPKKTNSYLDWSRFISNYANSGNLDRQYEYWTKLATSQMNSLPVDMEGSNLQKDMEIVTLQLDMLETKQMLEFSKTNYDISVQDILLSATVFALKQWSKQNNILLSLENHGRDAISTDLDITRTIGWFTSVYPVLFDLEDVEEPYAKILQVKEVLRNVPTKGIGYQLLKYLAHNKLAQKDMLVNPEIVFNYYGKIDDGANLGGDIKLSQIELTNTRSPNSKRRYKIEFIAMIKNEKMIINIGYGKNQYHASTINGILKEIHNYIKSFVIQKNKIQTKNAVILDQKIEPFNDVYYHDCLFNAFFPVVNVAGGDIRNILANDISIYQYNDENKRLTAELLQVESIQSIIYKSHRIYANIKTKTENIIDEVKTSINNGNYIVVHVDCFYENIRKDMFHKSHWTHALLIYGYDDNMQEVYILEHDDVNSLTYSKKVLKYNILSDCVDGYIANFQRGKATPLFYVINISNFRDDDAKPDFEAIYRKNVINNIKALDESIRNLSDFIVYYEKISQDENYICENMDFLLREFNDIVKNKTADHYKFSKLLAGNERVMELSREITKGWSSIRAVYQKMKFSEKYNGTSLKKIVPKLQKIYEAEINLKKILEGDGLNG